MTSHQLKSQLIEAIGIIESCERYLQQIDAAGTGWEGVELQHRVGDFMDRHRDDVKSGCAP